MRQSGGARKAMRWPMRWHLKRRLERRGRVATERIQIMRDRALVQRRVLWNDGDARCGEQISCKAGHQWQSTYLWNDGDRFPERGEA